MNLKKAESIKDSIEDILVKEKGSRLLADHSFSSIRHDLVSRLVGISVVKSLSEGYMVRVLTDGYLDSRPLLAYFETDPGEIRTHNIGEVTILSRNPCPGNSICHIEGAEGTLGAYVRDSEGSLYALSNNHVLSNYFAGRVNDIILHPGTVFTGNNVFANVSMLHPIVFGGSFNRVDCGIARLVHQGDVSNEIPGLCLVSGSVRADFEMGVMKYGMSTRKTEGIVVSTSTTVKVVYPVNLFKRRKAVYLDQIEIHSVRHDRVFSAMGDSGSLVIDSQTHAAAGLVFAGTYGGITFANHIDDVLKVLKVKLVN
jgi:hypothetical protein